MKKVEVRDPTTTWKSYWKKDHYTTRVVSEGYIGHAGESESQSEKNNFVSFCQKYNVAAIHDFILPISSKITGSRAKSLKTAILNQLVMPVDSTCAVESRDGRFYIMWLMKHGEDKLLLPYGHMNDNKWLGCYGDHYYTAKIRAFIPEETSFLKDRDILLWEVVEHKNEI